MFTRWDSPYYTVEKPVIAWVESIELKNSCFLYQEEAIALIAAEYDPVLWSRFSYKKERKTIDFFFKILA